MTNRQITLKRKETKASPFKLNNGQAPLTTQKTLKVVSPRRKFERFTTIQVSPKLKF